MKILKYLTFIFVILSFKGLISTGTESKESKEEDKGRISSEAELEQIINDEFSRLFFNYVDKKADLEKQENEIIKDFELILSKYQISPERKQKLLNDTRVHIYNYRISEKYFHYLLEYVMKFIDMSKKEGRAITKENLSDEIDYILSNPSLYSNLIGLPEHRKEKLKKIVLKVFELN